MGTVLVKYYDAECVRCGWKHRVMYGADLGTQIGHTLACARHAAATAGRCTAFPDEIREQRTCSCVECSICNGAGSITLSDGLGHYDAETEPCDNCQHGIVEECDYCHDEREREEDARSLQDLRELVSVKQAEARERIRADAWRWPHVKPDVLESVIGAVGEISIIEAREALARIEGESRG